MADYKYVLGSKQSIDLNVFRAICGIEDVAAVFLPAGINFDF